MTYRCIAADPPWEEKGGGKSIRGAQRHYPVMPVDRIISTMRLNKGVRSVCHAPRTRHSRKPDRFYSEHVERLSPGPRLEMFARESRGREWDVMGNEVE